MLGQLFSWWRYRNIKHDHMHDVIWRAPLLLSTICSGIVSFSPSPPHIFGEGSISNIIFVVFSQLPGFYIATLAAVAALRNKFLDIQIPEPTPTIPVKVRGEWTDQRLSLRAFLLLAAGYLSAISLLILIASASLTFAFEASAISKWTPCFVEKYSSLFEFPFLIALLYFPFSALVTTLHLIYFLADGAHQAH